MSAWCDSLGRVGEQTAVDLRVQRDHPVVEDPGTPVTSATSVTGTPASAIAGAVPPLDTSSHAELVERRGELDEAGLVVDGQQGPHQRRPLDRVVAINSCSTAG